MPWRELFLFSLSSSSQEQPMVQLHTKNTSILFYNGNELIWWSNWRRSCTVMLFGLCIVLYFPGWEFLDIFPLRLNSRGFFFCKTLIILIHYSLILTWICVELYLFGRGSICFFIMEYFIVISLQNLISIVHRYARYIICLNWYQLFMYVDMCAMDFHRPTLFLTL